jgi:predicted ribosomally synthesized peptide with nif11-like leader
MSGSPIDEFMALVQQDAAVQERVALAAQGPDALEAVVREAAAHGFAFTPADLRARLDGQLSDAVLDQVAGGVASPKEWFAEAYAVTLLKRD